MTLRGVILRGGFAQAAAREVNTEAVSRSGSKKGRRALSISALL